MTAIRHDHADNVDHRRPDSTDNRLAAEARTAARLLARGTAGCWLAAAVQLAGWTHSGEHRLLSHALVSLTAGTLSCLLAVRWSRRGRWYIATAQWWDRLADAPTLRPWPVIVDRWLNRSRPGWAALVVFAVALIAATLI